MVAGSRVSPGPLRLVGRTDYREGAKVISAPYWDANKQRWAVPGVTPEWTGFPISRDSAIGKGGFGASRESEIVQDPFGEAVLRTFNEARHLLLSKHRMYSAKNISQSPGGALNGLRVRIWDKVARLNNIIEKDLQGKEEHESLRDTFVDLQNYAAIAVLVLDGNWPGVEDPS